MNQQVILAQNSARSPHPCEERRFHSHDQSRICYRHWPATANDSSSKDLVLFHRGHEHGGRMAQLADELNMPEAAFFAWDDRALGRSDGERGRAPSFAKLVRDVDCFIQHVGREYPGRTPR